MHEWTHSAALCEPQNASSAHGVARSHPRPAPAHAGRSPARHAGEDHYFGDDLRGPGEAARAERGLGVPKICVLLLCFFRYTFCSPYSWPASYVVLGGKTARGFPTPARMAPKAKWNGRDREMREAGGSLVLRMVILPPLLGRPRAPALAAGADARRRRRALALCSMPWPGARTGARSAGSRHAA